MSQGAALKRLAVIFCLCLAGFCGSLALAGGGAVAQTPLVPPPGEAAPAAQPSGFWQRGLASVHDMQRDLHRRLAAAVRAFKQEGAAAAGALILVSLL